GARPARAEGRGEPPGPGGSGAVDGARVRGHGFEAGPAPVARGAPARQGGRRAVDPRPARRTIGRQGPRPPGDPGLQPLPRALATTRSRPWPCAPGRWRPAGARHQGRRPRRERLRLHADRRLMEDDRGMSEHVETAGAARLASAAQERGPAGFSRLAGCYALEARGADAVEFLHGQLANDVKGLPDGGSSRSLLLNHKGQAMAEAQVLRLEPRRLVLVVDDDMGEWVRETLARHIVFDEVELTPVACEVVTLQGANARGAVEAAGLNVPAAGITVEASGGSFVYATSRTGAGGYDVLVIGDPTSERATSVEDALARAGAGKVRPGAIDAARVVTLVATAGREGGEGVLPQE